VVDLAIGVDQDSSILLSACYNGIYGLKGTHGLIPFTGIAPLTPTLDHVGPMAATIEDIALLLKTLAGYNDPDPQITPESPIVVNVKDYPSLLSSFTNRSLTLAKRVVSGIKIRLLRESCHFQTYQHSSMIKFTTTPLSYSL
jgi:amidase